ncbi:MAG TPA: hypothetical protein VL463_04395 [Kofleriaceae bacterium]|jgi:hypothetical protein|nr:hypothetical protein [Kofleriaceae bacterium]
MHKKTKKLSLGLHTIRNLDGVAGGRLQKPSKAVTYCTCPSVEVCITLDPPCGDPTVTQ